MQNSLQATDRGSYDQIEAVGLVSAQKYIDMYAGLFAKRDGSDNVYFLVDILNHPSVLGLEEFAMLLHVADEHKIGKIWMFVASNDPARPTIGHMVEAMSPNFEVDIKIKFYSNLNFAEKAILQQIRE